MNVILFYLKNKIIHKYYLIIIDNLLILHKKIKK